MGFDGEHFSYSPRQFHDINAWRSRHFPHGLVTTASHDHKRGEDVRARLAALSENPEGFANRVERWRCLAAPLRQMLPSGPAPAPGDELILYQMLLGAWPPTLQHRDSDGMREFAERLAQWQLKALREAKLRTHWLWPDAAYETACRDYLQGLLTTPDLCHELEAAARELDLPGALNGLVQTALRLTVPGISDLYQGNEFWDYSLVDPDNRRAVDHVARQAALATSSDPEAALAKWQSGSVKQQLIARLLALRHTQPALFRHGDYRGLAVTGKHAERVVAFLRSHGNQQLLVIVPRLVAGLLGNADCPLVPPQQWAETHIQLPSETGHAWQCALTGTTLRITDKKATVAKLLDALPVGVYLHDTQPQKESCNG